MRRVFDPIRRSWDWLGTASDTYGRVTFLLVIAGFAAATGALLARVFGVITTVVVVAGLALFLGGMIVGTMRFVRSLKPSTSGPTGTLIPPGYNAIITGSQAVQGEWVPPGFSVMMGPGPLADEYGNSIAAGSNARIYGGTGNTIIGSEARTGSPPWCRC